MAQIFCLDGDRAGNLRRIENAVAEASKNDADIVCFPEAAILGWVNPDAHKRAFAIPGPDTEFTPASAASSALLNVSPPAWASRDLPSLSAIYACVGRSKDFAMAT